MALHGSIDSFPIVDVLRLLGSTDKSGRLTLDGDRGRGSVWFENGMMVDGDATSLRPGAPVDVETVVFDLFRFGSGSFQFEADATAPSPVEPLEVGPTLERSETMFEEFLEITSVVPGTDSGLALVAPLARTHVTLDKDQWAAVVAIGSGATVDHVSSELGLGELDALRLTRDLVTTGIVEIRDVAPSVETPSAVAQAPVTEPDAAVATAAVADDEEARPCAGAPVVVDPVGTAEAADADADVDVDVDVATGPADTDPIVSWNGTAGNESSDEISGDDLFTSFEVESPAPDPAADVGPTPFAMPASSSDLASTGDAAIEPTPAPPVAPPAPPVAPVAAEVDRSVQPGTVSEPSPAAAAHGDGSSLDELFGEFDPFGRQGSGPDNDLFAPLPEPTAAPMGVGASAPTDDGSEADEESLEAQMAMLSPAAAEAIAAARRSSPSGEGSDSGSDHGREAVNDYLGRL